MNFTWFASAYDNDDVLYRLATLAPMSGALVIAAGVARGERGPGQPPLWHLRARRGRRPAGTASPRDARR